MSDISKVTLPNGSTYNIKDTVARNQASTNATNITTANSNITKETEAREAAITDITNKITAEASARQQADTNLTNQINNIKNSVTGAMHYVGMTTTVLKDGDIWNMSDNTHEYSLDIIIGGNSKTYFPKSGDVVIHNDKEFVFSTQTEIIDGVNKTKGIWNEFGSTGSLKALAFKDSASGSVTPSGTVSTPTFTGTEGNITAYTSADLIMEQTSITPSIEVASYGTNGYKTIAAGPNKSVVKPTAHVSGGSASANTTKATIKQVSGVGTLPSFTASVTGETLSLGFSAGSLPTTSDASIVTGVSLAYTNPKVEVSPFLLTINTNANRVKIPVTGTFTPQGTISNPTFTGNAATVTVK